MDGLSTTASVIAVVQVTGSLAKLCGGYIKEVKEAREEIARLQRVITSLRGTTEELSKLLQVDNGKALAGSSHLVNTIIDCLSDVQKLESKLDPGKGKMLMRKVGFRALKWPLSRGEVEGTIQDLEGYKSSFLLALQVDQTSLLIGMAETTHRIHHHMDLTKLAGVKDAAFGSFVDQYEVQCLQGTRAALLQEIMEWAASPSQKCIFWLRGMAGTGKSTVSRTVAQKLQDTHNLGASFFFKRGEGDRGNASRFFPTLASQLITKIPGLGSGVQKAFDQDPDITSRSLGEQFDKLLLRPLLELDRLAPRPRFQAAVIVIDALDECDHSKDIRNIIQLLPRLKMAKAVRLRVFLTSRPELSTELGFSAVADDDHHDLALHDIPEEMTGHDIHLYLQNRFAVIKRERRVSQVPWPEDGVIQKLVAISIPLFISAATICRYIEHSRWDPKLRLSELLADQAKYTSGLEKTYLPILTQLLNDDDQESDEFEQQELLRDFKATVGVIILLAVPLSINALSPFLGINADQISIRLESFRSVLNIPNDRNQPVRTLHLSFRDFLTQSKSKFTVDKPAKHREIALLCLKTMRSHLRRDICNLDDFAIPRTAIDPQSLQQHFPPELDYSCRYWVHHVGKSTISPSDAGCLLSFLEAYFLYWVEAMSLLGLITEVLEMLNLLEKRILIDAHPGMTEFLYDAKRFILKNVQMADDTPLQLYCSGLVFAPRKSIIRTHFQSQIPSWIVRLPETDEIWSLELQTLEGHTHTVWSVAFSSDRALMASGSGDTTIRLWNTATGTLQQTLEGHSKDVSFVAFSPNCTRIASGSGDGTIRLWDTMTGVVQQIIECGSKGVNTFAFSPDGTQIVSGSSDGTLRIWDTATATLQQTFDVYFHVVTSVAFSPNGAQIVTGSQDGNLRILDVVTGGLQQTLQGHDESVSSAVFSPDGMQIASASGDGAIRLWHTKSGALQHTIEGNSESFQPIAFSPDGTRIASSSRFGTVCLWGTRTGALQQTLEVYSASVICIAFSPDGTVLACGSLFDHSIRLWDMNPAQGALQKTIQDHSCPVYSIAFSPNGALLAYAAGRRGSIVHLWDTNTGALKQALEGHSQALTSLAFSSDGVLLVSCSMDSSICLWNLVTAIGTPQQTFIGHSFMKSVAFSPDGTLLVSGSRDKSVCIWDTTRGTVNHRLEGHSSRVQSVSFSPDGDLVASSSGSTVCLWNTKSGTLHKTFELHGSIDSLQFVQDGSYLITHDGFLDVQSGVEISSSRLDSLHRRISMKGQWIQVNGRNTLWLPPGSRPECFAIHGNLIAMGLESGRIYVIGFQL